MKSNVSGGGRLHFFTIQQSDLTATIRHWLVLDFTDAGGPNEYPNIEEIYDHISPRPKYYPPASGTDDGIDNVKTIICLDRMFRKGMSEQSPIHLTVSCWRQGVVLASGYTMRILWKRSRC